MGSRKITMQESCQRNASYSQFGRRAIYVYNMREGDDILSEIMKMIRKEVYLIQRQDDRTL